MNDSAKRYGILLSILLCSLPAMTRAQAPTPAVGTVIQGRILDAESREPVPMVEVVLIATVHRTTTDHDGRFAFQGVPRAPTLCAPHDWDMRRSSWQTSELRMASP